MCLCQPICMCAVSVPTTRQGAARLAPTPSLTCERVAHQVRLLHGAHWPHPMLLAAVAEHHLRHNKFLERSWRESQVLAQPSLLSTSAGALAAGAGAVAGQGGAPGSGGAALPQSRRPCCPCRRLEQRRNLWEPALQLRNTANGWVGSNNGQRRLGHTREAASICKQAESDSRFTVYRLLAPLRFMGKRGAVPRPLAHRWRRHCIPRTHACLGLDACSLHQLGQLLHTAVR